MELALFLGSNDGSSTIVAEAVLEQVPESLDLLVSAETPGTRSFGLPGHVMAREETPLAALLFGNDIVVGKDTIIDHGGRIQDDLASLPNGGRRRDRRGDRCRDIDRDQSRGFITVLLLMDCPREEREHRQGRQIMVHAKALCFGDAQEGCTLHRPIPRERDRGGVFGRLILTGWFIRVAPFSQSVQKIASTSLGKRD